MFGRDATKMDMWERHIAHLLAEAQPKKKTFAAAKLERALKAKGQARTVEQVNKVNEKEQEKEKERESREEVATGNREEKEEEGGGRKRK